jgi:hypothetical protein
VTAEGQAFQLNVAGSSFAETTSIIYVGANALSTLLLSDSLLTATVPASMIAAPASLQITVCSPDWSSSHWSSNALTLQILPATPSVIPSNDTLGPNGTRQFAVLGFDHNQPVSWSVEEGAAGGTITSAGFYTAPAQQGTLHVIATAVSDAAVSATATVTVTSSGFTPTGPMHVARSGHTATLLTNGKVLIVGGGGDNTAELFNPTSGEFSLTGSLLTGRSGASATLLSDGRVLIAGGLGPTAGPNGSLEKLNTAEIYDPSTGKFSATGSMQQARWNHVATLLNDERVLVTGGQIGICSTASAELFDPATGIFSSVGFMLSARLGHTATLLATGEVLVAGGLNGCRPDSSDDPPWDPLFAELFEPTSNSFRGSGNMSTTRIGHSAVRLPDVKVLVLGGIPAVQNLHAQPTDPTYAELYDPAGHTFSPVKGLSISHESYTATLLSRGIVLIVGGQDAVGNVTSEVQRLDTSTATLTATGSLGVPRVGHTATLLQDGRVLVTGGTDASGQTLASAELYQSNLRFVRPELAPE